MDDENIQVLLICDDTAVQEMVATLLQGSGDSHFTLTTVATIHGLSQLLSSAPHVCLIAPDACATAGELLRQTKLCLLQTPIIVLFNADSCEESKRAERGAADYLEIETLSAPLLSRTLRFAVERHSFQSQIRKLSSALQHSGASVMVTDADGAIVYVNEHLCELTGYSRAELMGRNPRLFQSGQTSPQYYGAMWQTIASGQEWHGEWINRKKNGDLFHEAVSITPLRDAVGAITHYVAIKECRDEQSSDADELRRLSNLYAGLSQINQAVIRSASRESLFLQVCRSFVEYGGFRMAWIGWHDATTQRINPVASWGDVNGYLDNVKIYGDDRPEGRGPTGTAFREGRPYICNDFLNDPGTLPWREAALRNGYASSGVFPITFGGNVVGALSVYSGVPWYFRDKEIMLLAEAAEDVSFALENLARHGERRRLHEENERLEAKIEKQSQRQENLTRTVPGIVWEMWFEPDVASGRENYVSEYIETMLGFTQGECLSSEHFWQKIIHPDDWPQVEARVLEIISSGSEGIVQCRCWAKDGRMLWCEMHLISVCDEFGTPAGVRGVSIDITESKLAGLEIQRSQTLLSSIVNSTDDFVFVVDAESFRVSFANHAFVEYFARERGVENVIGQGLEELFPPGEFRTRWDSMLRQALRQGGFATEYRVFNGDRILLLNFQVLKRDEKVFGISVFAKDITHTVYANQRLRQLSLAVEQSPVSVVITDKSANITYVNPKFTEITGYSADEVIGKNPRVLQSGEMPRTGYQAMWQDLGDGRIWHGEFHNRKKNGELFWEAASIAPIVDENGEVTHYVAVKEDITARKGMEEALRRSNEQLEQRVEERTRQLEESNAQLQQAKEEAEKANHAKSDFLSRMSHELRTPLNAIIGFGQVLEGDDLTADQRESVDFILKGGQHLLGLINEVLDISRIESGRLHLSIEPVDVHTVVRETLDLVRPLAAPRRIIISETISATIAQPLSVLADMQRLKQVLLNLLSNALKYNYEGGSVVVECEILRNDSDDERVRLLVRDSGPGISSENIARLFVPFDRLGAEYSRVEGTGLGLAVSQRLIESMNGTLGVESTPGAGSTFFVELPRAVMTEVNPASGAPVMSSNAWPSDGTQRKTLLYIEDNLSNLHLVEKILQRRRNAVLLSALQGSIGIELARKHRPDLILLDLHLPDLTGYDVLMRLRAEPATREIPIVILSADATPGQITRLLSAGADGYLTKPLDLKGFLSVLDDFMGALPQPPSPEQPNTV